MTETELEGVMRRVQKLLAIAADDRANPEEASSAAAMAEKIMRKYQLDHVEVMRADFAKQENFDTHDVQVRMKMTNNHDTPAKVPVWAQWMAVAVGKLHDCKVSQAFTDKGAGLRFAGYKADVQVCAWTFDYLTTTTIRAVRAYQHTPMARSKAESDSYRRGFTLEIARMLNDARRAKDREQQLSSDSRSLVVLKMNAVAEKFGAPQYVNKSSNAVRDGAAFSQGKRDGGKVDVARRAVSSNSASPLRLAA